MERLDNLWHEICQGADLRDRNLHETLPIAEQFWEQLNDCVLAIKDLSQKLARAEPATFQPEVLKLQNDDMLTMSAELSGTCVYVFIYRTICPSF